MKQVKTALKTHLAGNSHTLAYCWLIERTDGTVFAFTTHDSDIAFDLETFVTDMGYGAPPGIVDTGTQTYLATSSFSASDVSTAAALNIDNMQIVGVLDSVSITEDDLRSGVWDYARFCVFLVNYADLTMGAVILRVGKLGDVTVNRQTYVAEMSGLLRAFQLAIGRLTSPLCDADVFDTRCTKNPAAFTVTGTLTGVSTDGTTLFDTARLEAGPSSPTVGIASITNANPGVVTMDDDSLGIVNFQTVTLSGIHGPVALNGVTVARNVSSTTFELPVDTSNTTDYPAYTTPHGTVSTVGTSGYFDAGKITMTSGPNNGRSMEVRSYVPGQWTLFLPFPVVCTVGDTYTMSAGCNKEILGDCLTKYANTVNHRGFPWLAGNDKLMQVGRK